MPKARWKSLERQVLSELKRSKLASKITHPTLYPIVCKNHKPQKHGIITAGGRSPHVLLRDELSLLIDESRRPLYIASSESTAFQTKTAPGRHAEIQRYSSYAAEQSIKEPKRRFSSARCYLTHLQQVNVTQTRRQGENGWDGAIPPVAKGERRGLGRFR